MACTPGLFGPHLAGFSLDPLNIPYPDDQVFVDYVFVNYTLVNALMKTKILDYEPKTVSDIPIWDASLFDTFEPIDPRPEQTLRPQRMYRCPFRKGRNKLVLCDYVLNGVPQVMNKRAPCAETLARVEAEQCWFGFEQEYFICSNSGTPLGWEVPGIGDAELSDRWAGMNLGSTSGYERLIAETHAKACLYAGIKLGGINREDGAAMWEYQVGPSPGLKCADDLVMSRHLLEMVAEVFGVKVLYKPKPFEKSHHAVGLHLNFSTARMRADGGMKHIEEAVEKLGRVPQDRLLKYYDLNGGKDNEKRLVGDFYVPGTKQFTHGIADKYATVRISPKVAADGKGFFEDRRPSGDANPYMVIEAFVKGLLLDEQL